LFPPTAILNANFDAPIIKQQLVNAADSNKFHSSVINVKKRKEKKKTC